VSTAVARGDEIIREPAGREEYGARLRNLNLTKNVFPTNSDRDAPSRQLTYK